jgi:hypothetical protein
MNTRFWLLLEETDSVIIFPIRRLSGIAAQIQIQLNHLAQMCRQASEGDSVDRGPLGITAHGTPSLTYAYASY